MIERVSSSLVPVAVNLYRIRDARGPGGDLFRSVRRQKDQYQGIWIVSPEGRVLAAHHDVKDQRAWTREVLATIDAGLAAFGRVPPRRASAVDPLPLRGRSAGQGGVVVALYSRYMHEGRPDGPVVLDSLPLSPEEMAALCPGESVPGHEWRVPEAVARKFCRVLSPNSDQSTMPRPEEVTSVRFTGKVLKLEGGTATIQYAGRIEATRTSEGRASRGDMSLTGFARMTLERRRLEELLFLFDGTYRHFPPYDSPRRTGAVAEWRR